MSRRISEVTVTYSDGRRQTFRGSGTASVEQTEVPARKASAVEAAQPRVPVSYLTLHLQLPEDPT